jgi:hypothetical protein
MVDIEKKFLYDCHKDDIEDDDDADVEVECRPAAPLTFGIAESLKRHFENNEKLAMIKSMMEKPQVI